MNENQEINNRREEENRNDLPFEPESGHWVDWIYDHRRGLLATVIVYLLLGLGVVTARISLRPTDLQQALYVDLTELDQLIDEKERLEREVQEMQLHQQLEREYYESIRNAMSNADGELNAGQQNGQGAHASDFDREVQALEERMRASREAYERGLQEAADILRNQPQAAEGNNQSAQSGKQSGNVTVSYFLPNRQAVRLEVPAYQCQGGGSITVDIVVNRNGHVVGAAVAAGSVNDSCLREFALRAAQASRFNTDGTADNRQSGTITYLFVPQ